VRLLLFLLVWVCVACAHCIDGGLVLTHDVNACEGRGPSRLDILQQMAEAAWLALTNKYEQRSAARKIELKRQYTNATMQSHQDPDEFMRDMDFARQQLKDNGHNISDEEFLISLFKVQLEDKEVTVLAKYLSMEQQLRSGCVKTITRKRRRWCIATGLESHLPT
jgi:gag-polypeptide of LTR copia-type